MKQKIIYSAIVVLTLGWISCNNSSNDTKPDTGKPANSKTKADDTYQGKKIFDIKTAKVSFNCTGGPETGTETLYIDDYGNTAVLVEDKKTQFGPKRITWIWKDNRLTIVNHETKKVDKSPMRPKATEPPGIADMDDIGKKRIGYEKMADENIAGKNCAVWFNAKYNIKYWLWNKLDLKTANQGVYVKEAISVEEITTIPASVVDVPGDYKK